MKVAIVDDELKMRQIMTDYVKRFGEEAGIELETVTFESGEQFLKDYKAALWRIGFLKQVFKVNLPYDKIVSLQKHI